MINRNHVYNLSSKRVTENVSRNVEQFALTLLTPLLFALNFLSRFIIHVRRYRAALQFAKKGDFTVGDLAVSN